MNQANELVEKANNTELVAIPDLIQKSIPELSKMLGNNPNAAMRFARIVTTDIRINPELALCTPISLMGAMFTAAELKLEPVAGRAYLLPFNNKRKINNEWKTIKEVQFVLGYRGIVDLFYRHASALSITWGIVHANEEFDYEKGSNAFLRHKPKISDKGNVVAYWVGAKVNGEFLFDVMSHHECLEHGMQHSKTYNKKTGAFYDSSPWIKSEDSMCLKTVLIQLSKTLPLSVEVQKAINADESTRYVNPADLKTGSVIDLPDETQWNESAEKTEEEKVENDEN